MRSASPTPPATQAERMEQRIRRHKEEVARLREEIGDPRAALFANIAERFDPQVLEWDEQPPHLLLWEDDELDAR